MDVELYVYDLSRGLARQMSLAFLGTQIDAVYHTALVFGNVEYFFGAGVQTCYPGTTHHGQPMQKIKLGSTELPMELILEYLESLKAVYTAESYDLFMHNCNNFTNDFATFLVGRGIPAHITSLPQTVLNTPFGQMLRPQLDQAMRGITQVPVSPANVPPQAGQSQAISQSTTAVKKGAVNNTTSLREVQTMLEKAKDSCAIIFFTSSTCAPCKICYAPYDNLAEEFAGQATLIKVDVNYALEIGSHYRVRATPTFMTFLKGDKFEEWSGADPAKLSANVKLLVQMAHPPHPHMKLHVPKLQRSYRPDLYNAIPPLEKLIGKLGSAGQSSEVQALKDFVQARNRDGAAEAALPDLKSISELSKEFVKVGQNENSFALVDLLRIAAVDPRVSGYLVEDKVESVWAVIEAICDHDDVASSPLKLVTVQLACNLFSTPLLTRHLDHHTDKLIRLATWLLLDEKSSTKIHECTATLILNIAKCVHENRLDGRSDALSTGAQVELVVCLLESIQRSEEAVVLERSLLALGLLAFLSPEGGELHELMKGMEASATLKQNRPASATIDKQLLEEVAQVLP